MSTNVGLALAASFPPSFSSVQLWKAGPSPLLESGLVVRQRPNTTSAHTSWKACYRGRQK